MEKKDIKGIKGTLGIIAIALAVILVFVVLSKKSRKAEIVVSPVKALNFAKEPITEQPVGGGGFAVQVASLKKEDRAKEVVRQLEGKGLPAYIQTRPLEDGSVWYRVRIGNYDTKEKAESVLAEIKKDYTDSFIISGRTE